MRITVPLTKAYHLINHGACPVITTGDGQRRDAAPINWTMPVCDDPFLIAAAIGDGNFTDTLIKATGEFVVNVVGEALAPALLALGGRSGKDGDKFDALRIAAAPCRTVKPPRLAEAAAHIECRVKEVHPLPGVNLYIGEATHAEVEEDAWDGRHLKLEKIRTLHHLGGGLFAVTASARRYS
jgi:flavin reductase (DIM6/NTAB) family NADH-FMN oxidoreductase RutF